MKVSRSWEPSVGPASNSDTLEVMQIVPKWLYCVFYPDYPMIFFILRNIWLIAFPKLLISHNEKYILDNFIRFLHVL